MLLLRRFVRWIYRRCSPMLWGQEDFHMGVLYLWVCRWGRPSWEVYYFGPNVGSDGLDRLLRPLKVGTPECYSRIQNIVAADVCRLVGRFDSWQAAKRADVLPRHYPAT